MSMINGVTIFLLTSLIIKCIVGNVETCDENMVNLHMLKCYKEHIDKTIDASSPENAFYMEGDLLCRAYNRSSSYRQCLYSIFGQNEICSSDRFPFSHEYSKVYWKLVMSSCSVDKNEMCPPSPLSLQTMKKCHYSFDDKFPTKCEKFLESVKCMEENEQDLIRSIHGSICSRNKAYYYYYGDLAARLQLSINVCEQNIPLEK